MKRVNKFIFPIVFIFAICFFPIISSTNVNAFFGGTGVEGDPNLISSCADLLEAHEVTNLSEWFLVTTDLDCSANGNNVMIGSSSAKFSGHFNGGGHTITININTNEGQVGLFRHIFNGTVSDLRVAGFVTSSGQEVGGIVGVVNGASTIISRVANTARVQGGNYVGGIVGSLTQADTINDCYNTGEITGTSGDAGGIAGMSTWSSSIRRCYSRGNINGIRMLGGIVGFAQGSHIYDSFSSSQIKGMADYLGGITGYSASGMTNSYWDIGRSGKTQCDGAGSWNFVGLCEGKNSTWNQASFFKGNSVNGPFSIWDFTPTTGVWDVISGGYPSLQSIANDDEVVNDVESVPSPPLSLNSTLQRTTSINLAWSAPSINGYHSITKYDVEKSIHNTNSWSAVGSWINGDILYTTASELLPNTSYDFRVFATNVLGQGVPSAIGNFTTMPLAVPGIPTIDSNSTNASSILMVWSQDDKGSDITSCTLQYSIESGVWITATLDTGFVPASQARIIGLQPSTVYLVRVKVASVVGDSVYSEPVSVTTTVPIQLAYVDTDTTAKSIIMWYSEGSTDQRVLYGVTSDLGQEIVPEEVNADWQRATLTQLLPSTEYFYKIVVKYSGVEYSSAVMTFTTAKALYIASDEVGQINVENGEVDYTWSDSNTNSYGFSNQSGVALDNVNHRLFVADGGGDSSYNNRIMVFQLNNDNTLIDHQADFVLGQIDFDSSDYGVSPTELDKPRNVAFDNIHNRLFVSDTGNRRVLVYAFSEENPLMTGMAASYVLGQADFTHKNSATTQNRLNSPMGMSYDSIHNRLYVADMNNYRVLVFDVRAEGSIASTLCDNVTTGISNGMNASCVIGQPDFISSNSNTNQESFSSGPRDVTYDFRNEMIYVADSPSNRILVFDVHDANSGNKTICGTTTPGLVMPSGGNGLLASCILGQDNFENTNSNTTSEYLSTPRGLWYDEADDSLYISDLGNNRVLKFNNMANISNTMSASFVVGQGDFESSSSNNTSQFNLACPNAVTFDSTNHRLYVSDNCNNRVMMFDFISITSNSFADGSTNVAYSQALTSENSQGNVIYSIINGSLPNGLNISNSGVISGIPTQAGTYTFTVLATDDNGDMGMISNNKQFTILITASGETPAPTASLIIESNNQYTIFKNVSVAITTQYAISSINKMILSENQNFSNANWETYLPSKTFTLSTGDGLKTIYVKVKDEAGNTSDIASDSIVLDTIAPYIKITNIGLISNIVDAPLITYYFTSTNPVIKGITEANLPVVFKYGNQVYATTAGSDGKFVITLKDPSLVNGTSAIDYYAADLAGNRSGAKQLILIIGERNFPDWVLQELNPVKVVNNTDMPQTGVVEPITPDSKAILVKVLVTDDQGNPLINADIVIDGSSYKTDKEGYINLTKFSDKSVALISINNEKLTGTIKNNKIIVILPKTGNGYPILPILIVISLIGALVIFFFKKQQKD